MANTHLSPYDNETHQGREERAVQARQIIDNFGCQWDVAILGLDMNDVVKSKWRSQVEAEGVETAS